MGVGGSGSLHSDFLVHWTGKDINPHNPDYRTLSQIQREQYLRRLRDTLRRESNGLWMTRNEEVISIPEVGEICCRDVPMTCFTEIRLSKTYDHTLRYGCLGLGFSREFVISQYGAPVNYVTGTQQDKVAITLINLVNVLNILRNAERCQVVSIKSEESESTYSIQLDEGYLALFDEMFDKLKTSILFLKKMSDCPGDYRNFEEFEWRILYYTNNEQTKVSFLADDNTPPAKITFEPADLRIIVFPDDCTRRMALCDQTILDWFGNPPEFPIMVTINECLNF